MLKQGIHPKIVQERFGHASIQTTIDTYSHILPGLAEAAAAKIDIWLMPKQRKEPVKVATENYY
jgi:integrase